MKRVLIAAAVAGNPSNSLIIYYVDINVGHDRKKGVKKCRV